jgi:two-component system, response regulator YesN
VFIKKFINFFENFNVHYSTCGKDAIDQIKSINIFDLVILELKLPDMKGTQLIKKIKSIGSQIDTVILTGKSSKQDIIDAIQNHADDYYEKQTGLKEIKKSLMQYLQKRKKMYNETDKDLISIIEETKEYIKRNYNKVFTVKDVAAEMGLHPKNLSRYFKEKTGYSFDQYRLMKKIEHAKNMLSSSSCNINQIAYKLGYKNPESFIRIFKKLTQITPHDYRNISHQKKEMSRQ